MFDICFCHDQTGETVKRYDDVTSSLHMAIQEHQEIEKRSNHVAVELVKASEQLAMLRADVKDIDHKRNRQEKILRDINRVIQIFFLVFKFISWSTL